MLEHQKKQTYTTKEVDELRRQLEELKTIEQRCLLAEATLETYKEEDQLLVDSAPLAIFTVDLQGTITGVNRKMRELFAWPADTPSHSLKLRDCQGMTDSGIVGDIQCCLHQKGPLIAERPYTRGQEDCLHLRYCLSPVAAKDGAINGVMAIVEDYTSLRKTEKALKESERRYRQLFQSAPIALIEWDVSELKHHLNTLLNSGVVDLQDYFRKHPEEIHHCWELIQTEKFNDAFLDLMGISRTNIPSGSFLPTDGEDFFNMAREVILAAAHGNTNVEREATIVTTSGESKIVLVKSLAVLGQEDNLERVAIAMLDISLRKKAEAALRESEHRYREQALRDGLTGLYNQRFLYQSLATLLEQAKATKSPLSLLFIDLDHFKTVVDTHGHLNGSRAILKVAQTIDSCLQEPAYAVAYAGDEFVVVLPGMDPSEAFEKASEIRCRVRDSSYLLEKNTEIRLTASFGLATFPQHATDLHGLLAAADQALFAIKASGKDAICPCSHTIHS